MTGIGFAEDFLLVDSSEGRDQLISVYIVPSTPREQADVTYPLVLKGKSWQFPFLSQLFHQGESGGSGRSFLWGQEQQPPCSPHQKYQEWWQSEGVSSLYLLGINMVSSRILQLLRNYNLFLCRKCFRKKNASGKKISWLIKL